MRDNPYDGDCGLRAGAYLQGPAIDGKWHGKRPHDPFAIRNALLTALRVFVDSKPGVPAFLEYYHDMTACENPDNCAHCQAVNQAKAAIDCVGRPARGRDRRANPIGIGDCNERLAAEPRRQADRDSA